MAFDAASASLGLKSSLLLRQRPRRNRNSVSIRRMTRETNISVDNLVMPLFVFVTPSPVPTAQHRLACAPLDHSENEKVPIASMPGQYRYHRKKAVEMACRAYELGIPAIALFPVVDEKLKDKTASESRNPNSGLAQIIQDIKNAVPELLVITDVAMDPYSSDGHDGLVDTDGCIVNDATLEILAEMALMQARAGADIVAPSDMMDGRIGFIRQALDQNGFTNTGILSYAVKYASALYGPFREALNSAPRAGDKKTYQMDPGNGKWEVLREVQLDVAEGADVVMVKPALAYLDVIARIREQVHVPIAAYQVSGEYAMIKAAEAQGWLDAQKVMCETLISIKRAGADIIFTYFALEMAELLATSSSPAVSHYRSTNISL